MSRLLGHLKKQKKQKRKDVRAVESSVSELWIALKLYYNDTGNSGERSFSKLKLIKTFL